MYGAAVSEVEIDVLTGECRVLRSDLLMDVGASLNPGIDFGQIEGLNAILSISHCSYPASGAFVQGMGLV